MTVQGLISILLTLFLALQAIAQPADPAITMLSSKARALEVRGRLDLAIKAWQQVLWSNPKSTEALGALARLHKQTGEDAQARAYLDRLRRLEPNAAIPEPPRPAAARDPRLHSAESLAQSGKYEEATRVYGEVLGNKAPTGRSPSPITKPLAASKAARMRPSPVSNGSCAPNPIRSTTPSPSAASAPTSRRPAPAASACCNRSP